MVVEPAKAVYKATQAASQNLSNNSSALKESGSAGNAFANFSKGILDTVENTAAGIYNLANDPLGTVAESVNYLRQDPIGHSFIGATYNYYKDVAQASYAHDWDTVEYKLGSGLINLAGFAAVGGKTESALNKVKFPNVPIIKDIPVPQVVMADTGLGIVPVITTVPVSATIPSAVVAGAAGVANATAAGQVVYSVAGGPNQSGGSGAQISSGNGLKEYPDGSIRDSKGQFAGKTGVVPGTPGVDQVEKMIKTSPEYSGYEILGKEISVRSKSGKLRRYDIVVRKPDGTVSGIEVKSGTAVRTPQQRMIDNELLKNGGMETVGNNAKNRNISFIDTVEVIKVK